MTKKPILFGAAIEGLQSRKDQTISIRLGTQELAADVAGQLFGLQNAFVYVALKVEDFGREEIERLEALEADMMDDHRKSHSQRLRAVLFLNWKQDDKGFKTFATYYDAQMEIIISHYKSKLP